MNLNQAKGMGGMLKQGHSMSDEGTNDAVSKNIEAAKGLGMIVRSSMGPNGMNKLVLNHLEKTIVTSDCAAIVRELEVAHPAAKMLTLAAEQQESEVGDGTNFVVSFASELLKLAEDLLRSGLHPSEITAGYKVAHAKALEILPTLVCHTVDDLRDVAKLAAAIKPVVCSKQLGYEDLLAPVIAEACEMVMPSAASGKRPSVNVDSVRVCKLRGATVGASTAMLGMVLTRDMETSIKRVEKVKLAVFGCGIEQSSTETKGTILLRNADELLNYNKSEEAHLEGVIKAIADSGANVVVASGSISEMALHFLEKHKLAAIKVPSKWELRRLCLSTGATAMVRLGGATPEEMGSAALMEVQEIGGRKVTLVQQDAGDDSRVATIVLRASTESVLNDLERACDDGINAVKALCGRPQLVPGGGATEAALAGAIQKFGHAATGLDQYAITKFGEALEFVPRTLAENAGKEAIKVLSALYGLHAKGETTMGINIENGEPIDQAKNGVMDVLAVKESAMQLAVDAAITVLRVDLIIMSKQAGGPKAPGQGGPGA